VGRRNPDLLNPVCLRCQGRPQLRRRASGRSGSRGYSRCGQIDAHRHHRAWPGDPRLLPKRSVRTKAWMAGSSPAMTRWGRTRPTGTSLMGGLGEVGRAFESCPPTA